MDLIALGSLTLTPSRRAFSPPPPLGAEGLILRALAQQYGVVGVDVGSIFRSAAGRVLADLVSAGGELGARGIALLQAGVDALRVGWVLDRAGGEAQVGAAVLALRARGVWHGLHAQPLAEADLAALSSQHAAAWMQRYPLLEDEEPQDWAGFSFALGRARCLPQFPRHPRLLDAAQVEGILMRRVAAGQLPPTIVRCSWPQEDLWEVLYVTEEALPDPHPRAAVGRSVCFLTRQGGHWTLHWQGVHSVDAGGRPCGSWQLDPVAPEPAALPRVSEVERASFALAVAAQPWVCTHRTARHWPAARLPVAVRAVAL